MASMYNLEVDQIIITLTHKGYIKRLPATTYRTQHRGGRGIQGMGTHDDDFVEHLIPTSTHATILFFTNKGKVYRLRGFEIPEFGRTAKGLPLINLLEIEQDEWVNAVKSVNEFEDDWYFFFTTKHGLSKRTSLSQFANIRRGGLIAIRLRENDELISVRLTDGNKHILIGTKHGYAIRFEEDQVRSMGRATSGVRGIALRDDDEVVSMEVLEEDEQILHVTNKGVGKRTPEKEYRLTNRGGKGIFTCRLTDDDEHVVAVKPVSGDEDIMLITIDGVLIRIPVEGISITGRNTQGVRLIRVQENEEVATIAKIPVEENDEDDDANELENNVDDEANEQATNIDDERDNEQS